MNQREDTSLWRRFRRFLAGGNAEAVGPGEERSGEERPSGEGHAPRGGQSVGRDEVAFSALDLRDRVVVMLLFDQVIHVEQVGAAWYYWKDDSVETPDTLWRVVALLPEVDREAVYAKAARVYAFEPVDFNMYGAAALLRKRRSMFTRAQWRRMIDLNVAPVHTGYDEAKDTMQWTFASHDPARPAVKRLLGELNVASHVVRYAPQEPLEAVFDDALPRLARERTRQRLLPKAAAEAATQRTGRRFLEDFAHGSSSAEAALRKAEEHAKTGRASSAPGTKQTAEDASPPSRPGSTAGASLAPARLFDEVLAGVVQAGARAAYLFGNARGHLEIYHQQHRTFQHWRAETGVSAEAMIDFVSGRILSLRPARERAEEAVEYWMGARRMDLRPSIKPARDLPEALPAQGDTEVIIIEVLR